MRSETEKRPTTRQADSEHLEGLPNKMQQVHKYLNLYRFNTQEALDGLEDNIVRTLKVYRLWNLALSVLVGILCVAVALLALRTHKMPNNSPEVSAAAKPSIAAGPGNASAATESQPAHASASTESQNGRPADPETAKPPKLLAPDKAKKIIKLRSEYALTYFKRGTYDRLAAKYVHPEKGVHFYPMGLKAAGHAFSPKMFANVMFNPVTYDWGKAADAPVEARFVQYYNTYIYDEDYLAAAGVRFNEISFPGKFDLTAAAIAQKYPGCIFIEYRKNGKSLILVFESFKGPGVWYLVGVVHNA